MSLTSCLSLFYVAVSCIELIHSIEVFPCSSNKHWGKTNRILHANISATIDHARRTKKKKRSGDDQIFKIFSIHVWVKSRFLPIFILTETDLQSGWMIRTEPQRDCHFFPPFSSSQLLIMKTLRHTHDLPINPKHLSDI